MKYCPITMIIYRYYAKLLPLSTFPFVKFSASLVLSGHILNSVFSETGIWSEATIIDSVVNFAHILTASGKTQDRLYSSAHEIYFKRVRSSGRSISWLIASSSVWTIKSSQLSFTSETWYSSASGRMVKTVSSVKEKPQIH